MTEEEIIEVGERWDPRSFHADSEAARDSLFGVLVASTVHIFSIYVRIGNADLDKSR